MTTHQTKWADLDKLRVGRFGEYFAKMAFAKAGYDVYTPEVDDRAIDLVVRIDGMPARYLEMQVKTVRMEKPNYVFMRKRLFPISPERFLALVVLYEKQDPQLYIIPSTAWTNPEAPFVSRDYLGKKSEPEHGLTVSCSTLQMLESYRFNAATVLAA